MISLLGYFVSVVFHVLTFDYVILCAVLVFFVGSVLMIKSLVKGR